MRSELCEGLVLRRKAVIGTAGEISGAGIVYIYSKLLYNIIKSRDSQPSCALSKRTNDGYAIELSSCKRPV